MRALKLFGISVAVGLLALGAGNFGQVKSAQADCTITDQGDVCLPGSAQAQTRATIYRAHTPEPVTVAMAEQLAQKLFGLEAHAVELRDLGAAWDCLWGSTRGCCKRLLTR